MSSESISYHCYYRGANLNSEGTDEVARYLKAARSTEDPCITGVMPLDINRYFPQAGYEVVITPDDLPANFNEAVDLANGVFIYITTGVERQKHDTEWSFNGTGQFEIAHFSDLHHGNVPDICRDVPDAVRFIRLR